MVHLGKLRQLSGPHCVLLAAQFATDANINALRALSALRDADLDLELVLRILLTYLPEGIDPSTYTDYLYELATESRTPGDNPAAALDVSSIKNLSNAQARRKGQRLNLLPLVHPFYKAEIELDLLSAFLIHRAHRIDTETGLLDLVAQLVAPFLSHSEYLRTWFISTVLPLLRLSYEYYPHATAPSLDDFSELNGKLAIEYQLSNLRQDRINGGDTQNAARDIRGVIGPWICGANDRKRRKLSIENRRASAIDPPYEELDDWECLFEWMLQSSREDFALILSAIVNWDGPEDLDLGGYEEGRDYIGDDTQRRVEIRYAQTGLACLYVLDKNDIGSIQSAHELLRRISDLLNYDPSPNLNVDIGSLPSYDLEAPVIKEPTTTVLQDEQISRPVNPITQPKRDTVRLLELLLFSTTLLFNLQHPVSVKELARMYLRNDGSEQYTLLQKILHGLSSGSKKDAEQWKNIRLSLLWLWNWGVKLHGDIRHGQGIFGKLESTTIETEILKALLESSHYSLAVQIYHNSPPTDTQLPLDLVERVVLASAMHHYDNASNGNRTRGGMKRAADIIAAFSPYFASSSRFQRAQALLSATHALSFYSLILQHGVPFQPVNIRVSSDPLSLVRKLLSQNKHSYTHLDDLVSIGQNLIISMPSTLMDEESGGPNLDPTVIGQKKIAAERRVIDMAVEAALEEDDFETAYSYVSTRLTPPTSSPVTSPAPSNSSLRFPLDSSDSVNQEDNAEDVAWRAALRAGRYDSYSSSISWSQASTTSRPDLRRLEQRMELLSQALLLAPPRHLEEVLAVWQQCEAKMTTLLAEETEAEERFNDAADRKLPGAFTRDVAAVQPRREVGRGAVEEAPMGLFDVARGAAAAFSKSAFPLHGSAQSGPRADLSQSESGSGRMSMDLSDSDNLGGPEDRMRRRDMVANAVTGGLASGIGWVLGATPVQDGD